MAALWHRHQACNFLRGNLKYWILIALEDNPNHIVLDQNLNNNGSFSLLPKSEFIAGSNGPYSCLQCKCWHMKFFIGFPSFISAYVLLNFPSSSLPSQVLIEFTCKSSYRFEIHYSNQGSHTIWKFDCMYPNKWIGIFHFWNTLPLHRDCTYMLFFRNAR